MTETWECMICGEAKPESLLEVCSRKIVLAPGLPAQLNIKHCVDKWDCIERAAHVTSLDDLRDKHEAREKA